MVAMHRYQIEPLAEFGVKRSAEAVPALEKFENLYYEWYVCVYEVAVRSGEYWVLDGAVSVDGY